MPTLQMIMSDGDVTCNIILWYVGVDLSLPINLSDGDVT